MGGYLYLAVHISTQLKPVLKLQQPQNDLRLRSSKHGFIFKQFSSPHKEIISQYSIMTRNK